MRGERDYLDTFRGDTSAKQAKERLETDKTKNKGDMLLEAIAALIMEVKALRADFKDFERKYSKRR